MAYLIFKTELYSRCSVLVCLALLIVEEGIREEND